MRSRADYVIDIHSESDEPTRSSAGPWTIDSGGFEVERDGTVSRHRDLVQHPDGVRRIP